MSTEPDAAPAKQPAKAKPVSQLDTEGAIRVRTLLFRESVDLPTEQQRARISTLKRPGQTYYSIAWLPRSHVFLVHAFDERSEKPTHRFTIPDSWAVAEHEVAP